MRTRSFVAASVTRVALVGCAASPPIQPAGVITQAELDGEKAKILSQP